MIKEAIFAQENPEAVKNYEMIKEIAKINLSDCSINKEGIASSTDIEKAKKTLLEIAKQLNPEVWASYWKHVGTAPIVARLLAEPLEKKGFKINANTAEFLMWVHEIGKLITLAYNRSDRIQANIFRDIGLPYDIIDQMPSIEELVRSSVPMQFSEEQLGFLEEPTKRQWQIVEQEVQRKIVHSHLLEYILNVADNLGKTAVDDRNGHLFTIKDFAQYLSTQEERYRERRKSQPDAASAKVRTWRTVEITLENRRDGALLQYMRVKTTLDWLSKIGIEYDEINKQAKSLQPKIIVMARHGELAPLEDERVYNRDTYHTLHGLPPMQLNDVGITQMTALNDALLKRKFLVSTARTSPEMRAIQSLSILIQGQQLSRPFQIDNNFDDSDTPGPIIDKMTMAELAQVGGNVYTDPRNEQPESIAWRMKEAIYNLQTALNPGQIGLFVTHGDPSAWVTHALVNDGSLPDPQNLRDEAYLGKGEARVFVIDADGKVLVHYKISPSDTSEVY
jgi:broad specificity phosphatase PhoE